MPPQAKSTAYMVVSSLLRLKPKQRASIFDWARVLLVFRSGKPEEWELQHSKHAKGRGKH